MAESEPRPEPRILATLRRIAQPRFLSVAVLLVLVGTTITAMLWSVFVVLALFRLTEAVLFTDLVFQDPADRRAQEALIARLVAKTGAADAHWELVVDTEQNPGAVAFVGNWPVSRNVTGYYGTGYRTNGAGYGFDRVTWAVIVPVSGSYAVFARWPSAEDRASNAPFTVTHALGKTTILINQSTGWGRWQSLGTFRFTARAPALVTLTDNANGYVIADAVRFVLQEAD